MRNEKFVCAERRLKGMEKLEKTVLLAARVGVSGTFIYAALGKIARPDEFYASISNYQILNDALSLAAAYFLPSLELLCAAMFLTKRFLFSSGIIMSALLAVFMSAIASADLRGLDISCGCFSGEGARGEYLSALSRDFLLLCSILSVLICDVYASRRQKRNDKKQMLKNL